MQKKIFKNSLRKILKAIFSDFLPLIPKGKSLKISHPLGLGQKLIYENILFRVDSFIIGLIILTVAFCSCKKANPEPINDTAIVWVVGEQTMMKSINAGIDWIDYFKISNGSDLYYYTNSGSPKTIKSVSFYNATSGSITGDYDFFASTETAQDWRQGFPQTGSSTSISIYSSVSLDSMQSFYCGEMGFVGRRFFEFHADEDFYYSHDMNCYTGKTDNFYSIDFLNTSTGWVVGENSTVLFTKNKGFSWEPQTTAPGNIYNAVYIHKISSLLNEAWIAGSNGSVFKTTDNGTTWNPVMSGTTETLTSICFTNDNTAYFTGYGGVILKTSDNGSSFQKLNTGVTENINAISFMDENLGFAVGDHGTFLKTADGGNTWIYSNLDNSKNLYDVCFVKRFSK